ncbi:MAG: hypothetical protein ACPG9K_06625, partial [Poseidonibacter sp.]
MDIKLFNYSLLILAVGAYFIPVENVIKNDDSKDIPLVIFEKPIMHTLTEQNVSRTVIASHAVRYKTRDEMFDANVFLRNNLKEKDFKVETLEAQVIIKKGDDLTLRRDVKYINKFKNKIDDLLNSSLLTEENKTDLNIYKKSF